LHFALEHSLRTGLFGDLQPGITTQAQVAELLGPPDAEGGTSRRYKKPSIYLYGTVEFFFAREYPNVLTGVFWEAGEKPVLSLPSPHTVEGWEAFSRRTFEEIEDYLRDGDFLFDYKPHIPSAAYPVLQLETGARFTFNEEGSISSFYLQTRVSPGDKVQGQKQYPTGI
jgi:hypothetical protein